MAKLFYTLEEASQVLGLPADDIKQMAAGGKLQQFRDRDKLMFKRDQVDAMKAANPAGGAAGKPAQDSGGPIPVASGDTDKIDLKAQPRTPPGRKEDPRQATGISVFDADEIEPADPMAQTQVTQPVSEEEDLALDSVGSGSGLLDLTRESDDTSLGAELLDEIYPGSGGEASDAKMEQAAATEGSGLSAHVAGSSGLEQAASASSSTATSAMVMVEAEASDPGGNGLGVGMLVGATIALLCLLVCRRLAGHRRHPRRGRLLHRQSRRRLSLVTCLP